MRFRLLQRSESKLGVEPGIPCNQCPATKTLKVGMAQDALHQPLPQPSSSVALQDVVVRDIGKRGAVRNHASESHLLGTIIDAKAQRPSDGSLDGLLGY